MRNVSIEDLRKKLSYNFVTGELRWIETTQWTKAGVLAGCNSRGYIAIGINKTVIFAHRIAWALHYGKWPIGEIDHKNRNRSDNRISNLREVNHSDNCFNRSMQTNNSSGLKGVSWHAVAQKWQAHISANRKVRYLGLFENKEDAYRAYCNASKDLHGEFSAHQYLPSC